MVGVVGPGRLALAAIRLGNAGGKCGIMGGNMDLPSIPGAAVRHFQFIILGIWPVNLLTLAMQDHAWSWHSTPQAIMGLWEWGAFVSFSLALIAELGVKMFFALAERQRKIDHAREEGRQLGIQQGIEQGVQQGIEQGVQQGIQQGSDKERTTTAAILDVLTTTSSTNPDLLPALLEEYRARYRNGTTADDQH